MPPFLDLYLLLISFFKSFQILTGHQDNAEFALAMCPTEPYVLSGGGEPFCLSLFFLDDAVI